MSIINASVKTRSAYRASPFGFHLRRFTLWVIEFAAIALSGVTAFLLRFDIQLPRSEWPHLGCAMATWVIAKPVTFWVFGVGRSSWRYVSIPDIVRIGAANLVASVMATAAILLIGQPDFPRSIYFIDFLLCTIATAGVRVAVRIASDMEAGTSCITAVKRILIYGAGAAGISLAREIHSNPRLASRVCAFIDDDREKIGLYIQQIPVRGPGTSLRSITSATAVDEVLIAIPSATGSQMTRILQLCHDAGLRCKTIPGMTEIIEGRGLANQIRDVAVEDLLGRTPVNLDESAIRGKLEGRVALVTGAAGSIGSELCRQISRFRPAAIVGYDIAETGLFHLEQEFCRLFPGVVFCPEIGSIQNAGRLADVLERYHPSAIFHAAAYKHVPLMEAHAFEAVENNVFGTLNVALAAAEYGVDDFIMISSDKAVRPTNIMGATKRIAELAIRSLQNGSTKFVSVRFGNVLGSNGSVVPVFKEQIARGGPVTVTHPEMHRFFMTIPEACQLVLQSSTLGHGGEIFVLDMGEPVRIVDLARNLILLSGLRPDEDIRIEFSGMRAGEKLFEELHTIEENTLPTCHQKIKVYAGTTISWSVLERQINCLKHICAVRDFNRLILQLKEVVPEYNPSVEILQRALRPRSEPLDMGLWRVPEPA